jgi:hypothetical protein
MRYLVSGFQICQGSYSALRAVLSGLPFHSVMLSAKTLIVVTAEWLKLAYPAISRLIRSPSKRINPRIPSSACMSLSISSIDTLAMRWTVAVRFSDGLAWPR